MGEIPRRTVIKGAGAAIAGVGFPYVVKASALGLGGRVAPSQRVVMGFIGVGSMGGGHVRSFTARPQVQSVAVCDLRRSFRKRAKQRVDAVCEDNSCRTYHDYRELLGCDDIDAVLIATPDHWHALVAVEAARRGKDMYCEKPLSMSIAWSKAVRDAVKRHGVVFQFGTQQRSDEKFRLACELARSGRLGKLQKIMVGSHPSITLDNKPLQPAPDKEELDYEMWLGPAPWSDYSYERVASRAEGSVGYWMHIYDYCLGGLSGAWGIHHVDIAQWGNDGTFPVEISGTGVLPRDGLTDTPIAWEVSHKYANGVEMIHMDTATALERSRQFAMHRGLGILFVGTEGWVLVGRDFIAAEPESLLRVEFGPDEERLYKSNDHRRNFIECVKTRGQTASGIDSAFCSDVICHLDDIAIRLGRKLRWDQEKEEFVGDDQANRFLDRSMRSPWHL